MVAKWRTPRISRATELGAPLGHRMFARGTKTIKADIKKLLKVFAQLYARTFRSFSPNDLFQCLRHLGIAYGDTVIAHSSFDAFAGFAGKPSDVIAMLQGAIGPEGTLLMPTLPFSGTAVEYVRNGPVFDVRRTPSRMGLITELFRRSPGVLRSVHPTHPVAVWGANSASTIAGHHEAKTPCGKGTPYLGLLERHGKILLLGVDIGSMTFYHGVEEILEARLPASPFTQRVFHLTSKRADGVLLQTETRLFEPAISRRRNLYKLVPELKRRGAWRMQRVGGLSVILLDAEDVMAAVSSMADRGIFCYD
jgi:aminoglycoside 3-N-acetyltransferase